jgi:phosphoacetylglucosamine mutase
LPVQPLTSQDNGVKLVDPSGEMLDPAWEHHATSLANCPSTESLISTFMDIVKRARIDLHAPANIVYARDTRPSGPELIKALERGLQVFADTSKTVDMGVTTTPVLHYVVKATNIRTGEYGVPTEEGYMRKMAEAFKTLVVGSKCDFGENEPDMTQGSRGPLSKLFVDCANGVGASALASLSAHIGDILPLNPLNTATATPGALNSQCGADYVKTKQALPPSVASSGVLAIKDTRGCSLDGDADRIIYYYLAEGKTFRMLDGDKIAVMVAMFLSDLVAKAKLGEHTLEVGVVQTAYANGSSTRYLKSVSRALRPDRPNMTPCSEVFRSPAFPPV